MKFERLEIKNELIENELIENELIENELIENELIENEAEIYYMIGDYILRNIDIEVKNIENFKLFLGFYLINFVT